MREAVITEIDAERARQDDASGGPEHDDGHDEMEWTLILSTQVGKASDKALSVVDAQTSGAKFTSIRRRHEWRARLISIAAVCVAAVDALDRKAVSED